MAARFNATASRADGVTRNGYIGALGHDPKMVGRLLGMPLNQWTPVMTGKPGAVIFHVDARALPSEEEYVKMVPQIRETLLRERQQVLYVEWMQNLRRAAKIKDYRENYFDV